MSITRLLVFGTAAAAIACSRLGGKQQPKETPTETPPPGEPIGDVIRKRIVERVAADGRPITESTLDTLPLDITVSYYEDVLSVCPDKFDRVQPIEQRLIDAHMDIIVAKLSLLRNAARADTLERRRRELNPDEMNAARMKHHLKLLYQTENKALKTKFEEHPTHRVSVQLAKGAVEALGLLDAPQGGIWGIQEDDFAFLKDLRAICLHEGGPYQEEWGPAE